MEGNPYEPPQAPTAQLPRLALAIALGQVATGFVAGFAIWAAVAPEEAWDTIPHYSAIVFAAGCLASFARPRAFYWGIVGVYFGQVVAMHLLLPTGGIPILPPLIAVLIFGTTPAAVGAMLGAGIGLCVHLVCRRPPR